MKREPSQTELIDKAAQLFEEAVANDGILDMYSRGQVGAQDLASRLEYLRQWAEFTAADALANEEAEGLDCA